MEAGHGESGSCGVFFFFSSRRRHTRFDCDWSSDVCSSDLPFAADRIVELYVDLRAVERATALVEPVGQAAPLERLLERALRLIPRRIGAELLGRSRRQIETVAETERLNEHQLHDVEQPVDL